MEAINIKIKILKQKSHDSDRCATIQICKYYHFGQLYSLHHHFVSRYLCLWQAEDSLILASFSNLAALSRDSCCEIHTSPETLKVHNCFIPFMHHLPSSWDIRLHSASSTLRWLSHSRFAFLVWRKFASFDITCQVLGW